MLTRFLPVTFVLASVSGCSDQAPPFEPAGVAPEFARIIVIDGGGFDDASNSGATGGQWGPMGWEFVPNSGNAKTGASGVDACTLSGLCQLGDPRDSWGNLGPAPFDDPNPNPNGEASPSFGVMSNANFGGGSEFSPRVVNLESAIEMLFFLPPATPGAYLDFRIDAAFGSGQDNTGPEHNDFAVVEFFYDNKVMEAVRWSRDDLQRNGWTKPRSRMDCGAASLGSTQAYPLCTGWERHVLPVEHLWGKNVLVRIRIRQGGADNDVASFLAMDNVAFIGYDAVTARVDVHPNSADNIIDLDDATIAYVPVALLGSSSLNVRTVAPESFRLGYLNVARDPLGRKLVDYADLDGDGFEDVELQFDRKSLIMYGVITPEVSSLELIGILPDRTRVRGTDAVNVLYTCASRFVFGRISCS